MLFTYLIKRTDMKKWLHVNEVQILFFYSSMHCWYLPLMTINCSLMAINYVTSSVNLNSVPL